jgi:hypothetical protein
MNYEGQHVDTARLSRVASGAARSGTAPDGFSSRSASRSFADQAMIDALSPDGGMEPAETRAMEQLLGPPRNPTASGPTWRAPQYPYLNWKGRSSSSAGRRTRPRARIRCRRCRQLCPAQGDPGSRRRAPGVRRPCSRCSPGARRPWSRRQPCRSCSW